MTSVGGTSVAAEDNKVRIIELELVMRFSELEMLNKIPTVWGLKV